MRAVTVILAVLVAGAALAQERHEIDGVDGRIGLEAKRGVLKPRANAYRYVAAVHKFGRASDTDTGEVPQDVYDCALNGSGNPDGPDAYQFSASAETYYVSSDSGADTEDFTVQGLDADWKEQSETVTLTGTSPVTLSGTWLRVNRAFAAGTSELDGNVYIHTDSTPTAGVPGTAGEFRSCVLSGMNQTLQAVYTTPADHTGYIVNICLGVNGTKATGEVATLVASARRNPTGTWRVFRVAGVHSLGSGMVCFEPVVPQEFPGKTDIRIRATNVASNDTDIFATFDLLLYPDKWDVPLYED